MSQICVGFRVLGLASAMRVRLHSIQDKELLGNEVSRYLHNLGEDESQTEIASSSL